MNRPDAQPALRRIALCAALVLLLPASIRAAPNEPLAPAVQGIHADAATLYERERAACVSGRAGQDQATCLREAGAALQAARRGELTSEAGDLQQNAEERCKVFDGADRKDCLARVRGQARVSGSVEGGGILRETVTIVPAPAGSGPARARR